MAEVGKPSSPAWHSRTFLLPVSISLTFRCARWSGGSLCGLANWVYVHSKGVYSKSLFDHTLKISPVKDTWILPSQAVSFSRASTAFPAVPKNAMRRKVCNGH